MLTKLLLTCREVALLSSREFEVRLPRGLRMRMKVHGVMCKSCYRYRKQLRIIHSLIQKIAPGYNEIHPFVASERLSEESRERIKSLLKKHR